MKNTIRKNFKAKFENAKTNKKKWDVFRTLGANREQISINQAHNFNVDELNSFYASIHASSLRFLPDPKIITIKREFHFGCITENDISKTIKSITSNAKGHDEISIKFLKLITQQFSEIIAHIFNYSLKTCTFPQLWNKIIIRPIGKVAEPLEVSQTRPISNNSLMTKLFTSICNEQIKRYVEENKLLTDFQSGFRNKHSCTTALIRVSEDIKGNIANNRLTILVLLDIKSAYPSVAHKLLFQNLANNCFSSKATEWIKCFIQNKTQYVKIDGVTSNEIKIDCG